MPAGNIIEAFRDWLIDQSVTTSGQIKIHRASSGTDSPDSLWWLKAEGGNHVAYSVDGIPTQTNVIGCYYRNRSAKEVYDTLEALRDTVTTAGCLVLDGYAVVEIPTTFGPFNDEDIDSEDRTVGYIQVSITTRKEP